MSIGDLNSNSTIKVKNIFFGAGGTSLSNYTSIGLSGRFTNLFNTPITTIGLFRRVGELVNITLQGISGTANSTGVLLFETGVPPAFAVTNIPIYVIYNGSEALGNCEIDTAGNLTIKYQYNSSFPSGTVCGFRTFSITYPIL
jgi:hypothetical protein